VTAWEVYWIMQADRIVTAFAGLTALGAALMVATAFVGAAMYDSAPQRRQPSIVWRFIRYEFVLGVFTLLFLAGMIFMPTTKTLAAMYIVPKLTSPEAQQFIEKEYAELKDLLREALTGDHEDDTDSE